MSLGRLFSHPFSGANLVTGGAYNAASSIFPNIYGKGNSPNVGAGLDPGGIFRKNAPPKPPGVPNANDALNAAQSQTDSLRMRRGLLANIYAGSQAAQPVTGKSQLGG